MRILIINPPHTAIGSRVPSDHLPPLGLLSIAGPLIDNGFNVELLDADYYNMSLTNIVEKVKLYQPDYILMGHSGSTSAQPTIDKLSYLFKQVLGNVKIIIGGVYPTYHYNDIFESNKNIDFIVCGEGEQVTLDLFNAISNNIDIETVDGIAFKKGNEVVKTNDAKLININDYRVAWELTKDYNYTYWGNKKAVVIQFSRGCPYPCTYCGQSLFWKKFRTRDPKKIADEIEMLHKVYGVEVINFADENPSSMQKEWIEFLQALIEKNLNLILVGSIRADNIVRDAEFLHLYKKAGFDRFLLGIESYNPTVLKNIKKGGSVTDDVKAIQLLREHNIISLATYVVGFGDDKFTDLWNTLRQLLYYDPDQIQLLYATPHRWTPYFESVKEKNIIQLDQKKWDYKHQVLETKYLKPWQLFTLMKSIEIIMQTRPKALYRWLFHKDKRVRHAMYWYNSIGKKVWVFEWINFIFKDKINKKPFQLKNFWS